MTLVYTNITTLAVLISINVNNFFILFLLINYVFDTSCLILLHFPLNCNVSNTHCMWHWMLNLHLPTCSLVHICTIFVYPLFSQPKSWATSVPSPRNWIQGFSYDNHGIHLDVSLSMILLPFVICYLRFWEPFLKQLLLLFRFFSGGKLNLVYLVPLAQKVKSELIGLSNFFFLTDLKYFCVIIGAHRMHWAFGLLENTLEA